MNQSCKIELQTSFPVILITFVLTEAFKPTIIPTLSIRSKDDVGFALLTLEFPSRIKVVEAYPAYIFLSLVAEVGGYVGLFLGVSLLDFRNVVIAGVEKISAKFQ